MNTQDITRVEIYSQWVGFANPSLRAAKLAVTRKGDRFIREQFPFGPIDEISSIAVQSFLEALSRPFLPQLDPNLFDTPEPVLHEHYGSMWTDDHPSHLVRVTLASGAIITIHADTQHAYLLPLQVEDSSKGEPSKTYDPRLSRSIASLMPEGYLERERLLGHAMLEHDHQEYLRKASQVVDAPERVEPPVEATAPSKSKEEIESVIAKIFSREESDKDRAEAERTGKPSSRLLKRLSLEKMRELLAKGANPSVADDVGQTALMHAAFPPFSLERFRLLASAGADIEARRNDGFTGLHLACAVARARPPRSGCGREPIFIPGRPRVRLH